MNFSYLLLVFAGLALLGWGFPDAYRLPRPWRLLAALATVVGVVAVIIGTLLVVVPNFFKS